MSKKTKVKEYAPVLDDEDQKLDLPTLVAAADLIMSKAHNYKGWDGENAIISIARAMIKVTFAGVKRVHDYPKDGADESKA